MKKCILALTIPACSFTFISGANDPLLQHCAFENGRITQLEAPQRHERLLVAAKIGEGYGVCDIGGEYVDYVEFGESGNWNPATVLSHDVTSVTTARTSSDGIWTLTQSFTHVAGSSPSVTIAMTITNNTGAKRSLVISRYANLNASDLLKSNLDSTLTVCPSGIHPIDAFDVGLD